MKPDLCDGCARCPLRENDACAPPTGPADAKLLVVGEAPGKHEAQQGAPFVGGSGRMLRSALQKAHIDPETEVRYVNTVQCQPSKANDDPPPLAQSACTVLAEELARFQGKAILAVGRIAAARLLGEPYLKLLNKSRSAWDGYVHPTTILPPRVDLGHELADQGELYKSGKKKGTPKLTKRPIVAETPIPPNLVGVVACLHPAAVMRAGFSNVVQMKAAIQRAAAVANGQTVPELRTLFGLKHSIDYPNLWKMPEAGSEIDLVFDIENTDTGLTDISFTEVLADGRLGQRASWPWSPAAAKFTASALGPDSPYETLVAHNAAYDCGQLLDLAGIHVRGSGVGERGRGLACTMMAAQLDQPDLPKALGAMWRYLPLMPPWKHRSADNMRLYNLGDSVAAGLAWAQLRRRLEERGQMALLRAEMASIMVLDRMTRHGMPMDTERLRAWIAQTQLEVDRLHAEWQEQTGLTVHSGKQVLALLFETWGLPVLARTDITERPQLDESVVEKLLEADIPAHAKAALKTHQQWTELNKQLATYGKGYESKLDENGFLHPHFLPDIKDSGDLGTAAGRLSSSPNVQNVPEGLRWAFSAPEGYVIGNSDLRAVEGRVQAVLAEDLELLVLYDRPGFDMHRLNLRHAKTALRRLWTEAVNERTKTGARTAFSKLAEKRLADSHGRVWPISRKPMKTFLYGWNYGAGDHKIAESLGVHLREAVAIREAYEASRPATKQWRAAVVRNAASRRLLQNAFGRIRYFPGIVPEVNVRNQAINFFPQSTVADMFWVWFPVVEELLAKFGGHLINQVHDSFVWMAPKQHADEIVRQLDAIMSCEWPQIAPGFSVPTTHEVGQSWGEAEPVNLKAA